LDEQALLHEDEVLMIFNHAPTHRKSQISFRRALLSAVPEGHPLYYPLQGVNKGIGAADLYQGSRLFLAVRDIIFNLLRSDRPKFSTAAMQISRELVENSDASPTQLHDAIFLLEKHIGVLVLAGQVNAEQEYVTDFIEQMLQHTKPAIRDSVKDAALGFATHAPNSFASLRASVLHHVPIRSVDISVNLASTAARHNAPPISPTEESLRRDLEALRSSSELRKHRNLHQGIALSIFSDFWNIFDYS
jgi:hypothetical protein